MGWGAGGPWEGGRREEGREEGREGWLGWPCAVLMCCLGPGLAWGLCPGCDPHPTRLCCEGGSGRQEQLPARGSSQVLPERMQCLGAHHGPGLHSWHPLSPGHRAGGAEPGPMAASSSWYFYSATSEPLGPQGTLQAAQCCVLGHP